MEEQKKGVTESIIENTRKARGGLDIITDIFDAAISGEKAKKKIGEASEKEGIDAIKGYRRAIGDIDGALKEAESATKKTERLMEGENDKKGKNPRKENPQAGKQSARTLDEGKQNDKNSRSRVHHDLPEEDNPQVRKQTVRVRASQTLTEEVRPAEKSKETEARLGRQNVQDPRVEMMYYHLEGKYPREKIKEYISILDNPPEGALHVPNDVEDAYKKAKQDLARREREEKRIRELVQNMNKHLEEGKYSNEELRRYIRLLESNKNDATVPKDVAYAYAKAREERSRGFWGIFRRSEEGQSHYADEIPNTTSEPSASTKQTKQKTAQKDENEVIYPDYYDGTQKTQKKTAQTQRVEYPDYYDGTQDKKEVAQKPEEKKPAEVTEKKSESNMEKLTNLFGGVAGGIAMTAIGGPMAPLALGMINAMQQAAQQQQTTQQNTQEKPKQEAPAQQTVQEKPKQEKTEQKVVEQRSTKSTDTVQKSTTANNVQKPTTTSGANNVQKQTSNNVQKQASAAGQTNQKVGQPATSQTNQKASQPASQANIEGLRREIDDLKKRIENIEKQLLSLREHKNQAVQNDIRNGNIHNYGNNNNGSNNKNNANNKPVSQKTYMEELNKLSESAYMRL